MGGRTQGPIGPPPLPHFDVPRWGHGTPVPHSGARHFNAPQWGHGTSMPHSGDMALQCPTVGAWHINAPQWGQAFNAPQWGYGTSSRQGTRSGSPSLAFWGRRRLCRPVILNGYVFPWHYLSVNSSGSQAIPSHPTPSQAIQCPAVGAWLFNAPQWGHGSSMPHSGGTALQCPTVGHGTSMPHSGGMALQCPTAIPPLPGQF